MVYGESLQGNQTHKGKLSPSPKCFFMVKVSSWWIQSLTQEH